MVKPRLIVICRHAQSEGNKNREIHQTTPDHRVKLTPEGWTQAEQAGRKLRALLNKSDTLHFFTSPYRRTRETTEGILNSLTADDPEPSPFPKHTIKIYEEPRLREQDFGNFQPGSAEMARMWQERAHYGHFFYRIPNGESAADAYDRISGFNESLWRSFSEDDFASVCVLVTHGLMARVFLMKWYHYSVEYFEDLRNINHCEFVVLKLNPETGKYTLQNNLRTWTELRRERKEKERVEKGAENTGKDASLSPIPERTKWEGYFPSDGHSGDDFAQRQAQRRLDAAEALSGEKVKPNSASSDTAMTPKRASAVQTEKNSADNGLASAEEYPEADFRPPPTLATLDVSETSADESADHKMSRSGSNRLDYLRAGRDGGGSDSGASTPTPEYSSVLEHDKDGTTAAAAVSSLAANNSGGTPMNLYINRNRRANDGNGSATTTLSTPAGHGIVQADVLGDQQSSGDATEDNTGDDDIERRQRAEGLVDGTVR